MLRKGIVGWLVVLVGVGMVVPRGWADGDVSPWALGASVAWESRYVTEGVDNVPDSTFLFSEIVGGWRGFGIGAWWAEAFSDSYNEVQLFAEYGADVGALSLFAGVARLTFPSGADANTWEVFLGMEHAVGDYVTVFAETYYDVDEVGGGFVEAGFDVAIPVPSPEDRLALHPYVLLGADYGFVSGPRRLRENNVQGGIVATWHIHDHARLFGRVNHSRALTNLNREDEGDVSWGGFGVALVF